MWVGGLNRGSCVTSIYNVPFDLQCDHKLITMAVILCSKTGMFHNKCLTHHHHISIRWRQRSDTQSCSSHCYIKYEIEFSLRKFFFFHRMLNQATFCTNERILIKKCSFGFAIHSLLKWIILLSTWTGFVFIRRKIPISI